TIPSLSALTMANKLRVPLATSQPPQSDVGESLSVTEPFRDVNSLRRVKKWTERPTRAVHGSGFLYLLLVFSIFYSLLTNECSGRDRRDGRGPARRREAVARRGGCHSPSARGRGPFLGATP